MHIVIDISEEDYQEVLKDAYSGTSFENRVFSAIQNGIVLTDCKSRWVHAREISYEHLERI